MTVGLLWMIVRGGRVSWVVVGSGRFILDGGGRWWVRVW